MSENCVEGQQWILKFSIFLQNTNIVENELYPSFAFSVSLDLPSEMTSVTVKEEMIHRVRKEKEVEKKQKYPISSRSYTNNQNSKFINNNYYIPLCLKEYFFV